MNPFRGLILYKLVFAIIATILLHLAVSADAQQPRPPATVFDESFTLYLVTQRNPDGCTAFGRLRWEPVTPGPANLLVGDAFRITPLIHEREAQLVTWSGRWDWQTSRSCGKDTCKDNHQRVQTIPASFSLGSSLEVSVFVDAAENNVTSSAAIEGVRTEPGTLAIQASFAPFTKPSGNKPDPRARLALPFCVTQFRGEVKVLELHTRVVRRLR
ncbi:hypothetical protein L0Z66_00370 (plasmid) [Phaeobacter sp. BS34]|uniref:hypothetical protein n=1 Tax=Phaeobacter TaxID=302485 RepID=UPI0011D18611|nr:hypothetical protein [Phaeobacter inhibens]